MYVEYNGNSNNQRPYTGEIIDYYDEKDGGLQKSKCSYFFVYEILSKLN